MKNLIVALVMVLTAGSLMAQSNVGNVDSKKLLDTMPSRKIAIAQLDSFQMSRMRDLQEMQEDFEKAYNDYIVKKPTLIPAMQKLEEERLMKKEQALYDFEQSISQELQILQKEYNEPILKLIQEAIKIVAKRHKLSYVIDQNVTLYFDPALDITDEVIVELLKLDKAANPQ